LCRIAYGDPDSANGSKNGAYEPLYGLKEDGFKTNIMDMGPTMPPGVSSR